MSARRDALRAHLEAESLPVPAEEALARIEQFLALRARWSSTHDLAGPQALEDPRRDVADAVAVHAAAHPALPLVDVGAGGGVPGLLVAALAPTRRVELVEPRVKRVAFVRAAVHRMGLSNATVTRARWPIPLAQPVQVVSRAVVSPAEWPRLAAAGGPHVHAIIRMLARQRPPFALPAFGLAATVDYADAEIELRVERWDRA